MMPVVVFSSCVTLFLLYTWQWTQLIASKRGELVYALVATAALASFATLSRIFYIHERWARYRYISAILHSLVGGCLVWALMEWAASGEDWFAGGSMRSALFWMLVLDQFCFVALGLAVYVHGSCSGLTVADQMNRGTGLGAVVAETPSFVATPDRPTNSGAGGNGIVVIADNGFSPTQEAMLTHEIAIHPEYLSREIEYPTSL